MNSKSRADSVPRRSREGGTNLQRTGQQSCGPTMKWNTRRLGDPDVAMLVMGQSPPSRTYNNQESGLPFFQGKADFGYINPTARVWCSEPRRTGQAGDILMSVRAPVGDVNLATEACALGRGLAAIRSAVGTNSTYLFYSLQFSKPQLVAASSGAIFESINKTALHDLEISLPPLVEQEKIAAILWKLQRAIATQDRLIAVTGDLKQSAMQRLFTHGLRGEPLKDTEIGPMPESWQVATIGKIAKLSAGGTPSRSNPEFWSGGTIPWVKTGEINYGLILDTEEKITPCGLKRSAAKLLPRGTLLVAMYGQGITRGKAAILGIEAATNQACAAIRPDEEKVRTDFLFHVLAHGYERLRGLAHGGQQQNLNADLIRGFAFGYPRDIDEQRDIAAALATIDRKLAHHRAKRAALDALFQTTLHQLMTAQVRVTDLDIDISEVTDHVPDAGKVIEEVAGDTDHVVDANKMIQRGQSRARR